MSKCDTCIFRTEEESIIGTAIRCTNDSVKLIAFNQKTPRSMPLSYARDICSSKNFVYYQSTPSKDFVNFGMAVAHPSGRQTQYCCRYFGLDNQIWQEQGYELAIEGLRFANFDFPNDEQLTNQYHSLMIHKDDVQTALDALKNMHKKF